MASIWSSSYRKIFRESEKEEEEEVARGKIDSWTKKTLTGRAHSATTCLRMASKSISKYKIR
jgi:hypothetical protein